MESRDISFLNGDIRLAGTLYEPDTVPPYPCVVVLHSASGGTRDYPFYQHLKTLLPERGFAVLLFDRRGSGDSTGHFETSDFNDLAGDGAAAFDMLCARPEIDDARIFLYGISQGGWIAPIVAVSRPTVAGLVIVSGSGVSPARQMDYGASYTLREMGFGNEVIARALALRQKVNEYYRGRGTRAELQAEIARAQNETWFDSAYIDRSEQVAEDVKQDKWFYEMDYDSRAIWARVRQPTLFVFAEKDRWVPVQESISNFRAATSHLTDVLFVQVPGTDHLMYERQNDGTESISEAYVDVMGEWLMRQQPRENAG